MRVICMTENKRYVQFEFPYDDFAVKDNQTNQELWNPMIIDRLNEQDARIKELETVIQQILYETRANHTKREYSVIVSVSPQMHDKLTDLIREKMW